jgi:3'-phosphoadenosine 5'-phosphosulfate sulfotransferase (PAPS reductase)/FAD synthetase
MMYSATASATPEFTIALLMAKAQAIVIRISHDIYLVYLRAGKIFVHAIRMVVTDTKKNISSLISGKASFTAGSSPTVAPVIIRISRARANQRLPLLATGSVSLPLMHIDSKWKFKEMIQFRDEYARKYGWNLIVESNMEAFEAGVGPFTHGSKVHTDLMKTQALLHALDKYKFDAAFGGARRDEEKSRAKERIFSFRDKFHQWDPKNQRPELWDIYSITGFSNSAATSRII